MATTPGSSFRSGEPHLQFNPENVYQPALSTRWEKAGWDRSLQRRLQVKSGSKVSELSRQETLIRKVTL